jgi:hypothetical protein
MARCAAARTLVPVASCCGDALILAVLLLACAGRGRAAGIAAGCVDVHVHQVAVGHLCARRPKEEEGNVVLLSLTHWGCGRGR